MQIHVHQLGLSKSAHVNKMASGYSSGFDLSVLIWCVCCSLPLWSLFLNSGIQEVKPEDRSRNPGSALRMDRTLAEQLWRTQADCRRWGLGSEQAMFGGRRSQEPTLTAPKSWNKCGKTPFINKNGTPLNCQTAHSQKQKTVNLLKMINAEQKAAHCGSCQGEGEKVK